MPDTPAPALPTDLAASPEVLEVLLDIVQTGIMALKPMYDASGTTIIDLAWIYLNPAAQRMLQLPQRPTESFLTLFPTAEPAGVFGFYRDAFLSGQVERRQNNYQHDGLDGYYLLVARRQGEVLLVSFDDTNDQPRTLVEEELRASQARELGARAEAEKERNLFQAVLTQSPVAIGLFQEDDCVVALANEVLCAMWERTPAEILGRPLLDVVPELRGQGFTELMREVARTGVPFVGTEVPANLLRNGRLETTYYNFVYKPLHGPNQTVIGVLAIAIDVSEQVLARQRVQELNEELAAINEELQASNDEFLNSNTSLIHAQQALHALNHELESRVAERTQQLQASQQVAENQRAELQRLFEQAPVAICLFRGPDYLLEIVNPLMCQMLGRLPAELVGRPFFEAVPELTYFQATLDEVRQTGQPFVAQERAIQLARHRPDEVGYFDFVYHPLHDEHGQVTGIICVATEVTEQVNARQQVQGLNEELAAINEEMLVANEELRDANARLNHTNVDLDTFVYTASHDLKAPIANIEGLLLALREQLPPAVRQHADVAKLLGFMHQSVERFQRTLVHLTDISKLQQAHAEPAELVNLAAQIEAVRLDLAPALAGAQGQLTVDSATCATVRFSPKNLRSILYNLLSNAIKYQAPGRPPQVQLRAACANGQLRLEVQDNGLGLTEEQQSKLFVMFRRLHTHVEGTGVGLYMVKRIVENAGGAIWVQSTPGVGSTFFVLLPDHA